MGEQPNPWDLLQPQDATSRHRGGAKPSRRYGLLGKISLLSLRGTFYPLSGRFHWYLAGSLSPTFVPARHVGLAVKLPYCITPIDCHQAEGTFERLPLLLGGNRPSQTPHQALSVAGSGLRTQVRPTASSGISTMTPRTGVQAFCQSPTYPIQTSPTTNDQAIVKVLGSFRPARRNEHLTRHSICRVHG